MSKRYSGKSFKDSTVMKKPKLSLKEKRRLKKEKKKKIMLVLSWFAVCILFYIIQITLGNSGHALEVFAITSAIVLFLISKIKNYIK